MAHPLNCPECESRVQELERQVDLLECALLGLIITFCRNTSLQQLHDDIHQKEKIQEFMDAMSAKHARLSGTDLKPLETTENRPPHEIHAEYMAKLEEK